MMMFVAVDFGNTRTKFGLFAETHEPFPLPISVCNDFALLESWVPEEPLDWVLAWTGGTQYETLRNWIQTHRPQDRIKELTFKQIPLPLDVEFPEQVGIDRLLAALRHGLTLRICRCSLSMRAVQ